MAMAEKELQSLQLAENFFISADPEGLERLKNPQHLDERRASILDDIQSRRFPLDQARTNSELGNPQGILDIYRGIHAAYPQTADQLFPLHVAYNFLANTFTMKAARSENMLRNWLHLGPDKEIPEDLSALTEYQESSYQGDANRHLQNRNEALSYANGFESLEKKALEKIVMKEFNS